MRRTLAVLVTTAAFLAPAAAASATQTNASCSNGKGGNLDRTLHTYNFKGQVGKVLLEGECTGAPSPGPGSGPDLGVTSRLHDTAS